jgi:hypothetical protein
MKMQSGSLDDQDLHEESMQVPKGKEVVICPKCHMEGPEQMYCLNCGYPLYLNKAQHVEPGKNEGVDKGMLSEIDEVEQLGADLFEPENIDSPSEIEVRNEPSEKNTTRTTSASEPESIVRAREVIESLIKIISLELWLVNQLQEGDVREEQFNGIFDGYATRFKISMNLRGELLSRAKDLDSIERAMNEAKVNLAELEMKKTLDGISADEYDVKAPAYKWDISKHEEEISIRKREIAFLEDLTLLMPEEKITRMKKMAENCYDRQESLEKSCDIGSETAKKVKESLEEILACLDGFIDTTNDNGDNQEKIDSSADLDEKMEQN